MREGESVCGSGSWGCVPVAVCLCVGESECVCLRV